MRRSTPLMSNPQLTVPLSWNGNRQSRKISALFRNRGPASPSLLRFIERVSGDSFVNSPRRLLATVLVGARCPSRYHWL